MRMRNQSVQSKQSQILWQNHDAMPVIQTAGAAEACECVYRGLSISVTFVASTERMIKTTAISSLLPSKLSLPRKAEAKLHLSFYMKLEATFLCQLCYLLCHGLAMQVHWPASKWNCQQKKNLRQRQDELKTRQRQNAHMQVQPQPHAMKKG